MTEVKNLSEKIYEKEKILAEINNSIKEEKNKLSKNQEIMKKIEIEALYITAFDKDLRNETQRTAKRQKLLVKNDNYQKLKKRGELIELNIMKLEKKKDMLEAEIEYIKRTLQIEILLIQNSQNYQLQ